MSFRRLFPVREKAHADKGVKILQEQAPLSPNPPRFEETHITECTNPTSREAPVSLRTVSSQHGVEPVGQVDPDSGETDNPGKFETDLKPGYGGERSETAASPAPNTESAREVRRFLRSRNVILSAGSREIPTGWELMLDEEGMPYLRHQRRGTLSLGFAPGWNIYKDEQGFYFLFQKNGLQRVTRTDPRFAIDPIQEAAKRIDLSWAYRPHSCEHCSKIIVSFKSSVLKSAMLRSSFDNVRVLCADSLQSVRDAHRARCDLFYYLFSQALFESDVKPETGGVFLTVKQVRTNQERAYGARSPRCCSIFYESQRFRDGAPVAMLRLCAEPQPGKAYLVKDLNGPPHLSEVDSPAAIEWARHYLHECDRDHEECRERRERDLSKAVPDFIPSRLIEVANNPDRVQVVDTTESPPPDPTYGRAWACLSYAWGGEQISKTTKSNLATHAAGIPLVCLPPTIRDAVKVCRGLGLKYLWVDCLCIVQDDDNDMAHELLAMAAIYQQAYVTIVAACASGVWQGFLHDRGYFFGGNNPPPIQLRGVSPKGEDASLLAVSMPETNTVEEKDFIEERAWAYQEKLLSQRVLYYGIRGLSYFCTYVEVSDRCRPLSSRLENPRQDLSGIQRELWHECVEEYSKRQMFDPTRNKFNAISAIAREHGRPEQYVAGLWKNSFASDLAWCVVPNCGNSSQHLRPRAYIAPSWSWASVDSAVTFWIHDHYQKWRLSMLDIHRIHLNHLQGPGRMPLLLGPVDQGTEMDITGQTASVRWVFDDHSMESNIVTQSGIHFAAFPDTAEQTHILSHHLLSPEGHGSLHALILVRDQLHGLCGLVLECLTAASKYRRVGFFSCCNQHRRKAYGSLKRLGDASLECADLALSDFQGRRMMVI
ncbi:MAG: hypothetical protein Q9174_001499 [Haloplaca sp. 1 TL-2023]